MIPGVVTWAEIDLDAIAANVGAIKKHVGKQVEVIAVVKANAYGHGAIPVARVVLAAGAARLAVHRAIEGVELRRAGITAPILVMGYTPPDGAELIVRWNLTPSAITLESAQALSACAAAAGRIIPVHVKVDSGMHRYGLLPEGVVDFCRALAQLPGIQTEGLFTHFATANRADATPVQAQLTVFNQVIANLHGAGIAPPVLHAANSAAAIRLPEAHFNAVRSGIALYGLQPSAEWSPPFEITPALALKSIVSRIHGVPTRAGIGYGYTYITQRDTTVALVPVGYGDGYHRSLSNQGVVLIGGQRAPILGRVSMDQIVVDVSLIAGVKQDDEVVLIGRQGGEQISAEEVAMLAGTINYEVTTALMPRVARVYLREHVVIDIDSIG